jgi:hypothetical protein
MNTTKKPSLAAALHEASGRVSQPTPVVEVDIRTDNAAKAATVPPSRTGKRIVSGHFDPVVARQLKQIALDYDTTVQALLAEALNDLFTKYGKAPIAS